MKTFVTVKDQYGEIDIAIEDICSYHIPSSSIIMTCNFGTGNGVLHIDEDSFNKIMELLERK